MSHPVTRTINFLSSIHKASQLVKAGELSCGDIARKTVLAPQHFPKFLGLTMAISGFVGYCSMEHIHKQKIEREMRAAKYRLRDREFSDTTMSQNQAMVKAMVENARSSSWKENLDNAFEAHERFMLGSKKETPKFMEQVISRSNELRRQPTKNV